MTTPIRIVLALGMALVCAGAFYVYSNQTNAAWVVSPEQIAAARMAGKPGVETSPGTVAVLPIRSETADMLPMQIALFGFVGAAAVWAGTNKRKPRPPKEC